MLDQKAFIIEDWLGPYKGYTDGSRWNGWATPYFETEVAEQLMSDFPRVFREAFGEERPARFNAEKEAFEFWDPDREEWESFPAVEVEGKRLYPIGNRCWTWEEAQES